MFSKAWQAVAFVGFILIAIVFVFGGEGQPVGVSNAVDVAQQKGSERSVAGENTTFAAAPTPQAPQINEGANASGGFADFEIQEYGTPQFDPTPGDDAGWGTPVQGATGQSGQRSPAQNAVLPQGPPPPGVRDPSKAPPRIIPHDPSNDPDLAADVSRALARRSR